MQCQEDNSRHVSHTARLGRHAIHELSPATDPDADFGSPNFPYARQDKKDKVRRKDTASGRIWLC
jgi:hypothetical protein